MSINVNRAAAVLRGAAYGTVTPVDVIQRASGVSRSWARTAADRLGEQGFLVREFLRRAGPGRPTVGYRLTRPGEKLLESFIDAEASRFRPGAATAGPVWSLAQYGVALAGPKDAFVRGAQGFAALREVPAPAYVLENPARHEGVLFPEPERLVLWLIESGDERNVLAAPWVARRHAADWNGLWALARENRLANRLAFVLYASGQADKIPPGFRPGPRVEQLVMFGDADSEDGNRFRVTGTVPPSRFQEFDELYGKP